MSERRPLARLRKFHKGKRGVSQHQSHLANLHRELRGITKRPDPTERDWTAEEVADYMRSTGHPPAPGRVLRVVRETGEQR